jgi:hypothetical protein
LEQLLPRHVTQFMHISMCGRVTRFSREEPAPFEWGNLVLAAPGYLERAVRRRFRALAAKLPLASFEVVSYEVDCEQDLAKARAFAERLVETKGAHE